MVTSLFKRLLLLPLLAVLMISSVQAQFEAGVKDLTQVGVIAGTSGATTNTITIGPTQNQSSKKIKNIIRFKFNELATTTGAQGAPLLFFKSAFNVTVSLTVDVWTDATVLNPDQTLTPTVPLTINYDPATGALYNPVAYWVLPSAYEKVRVNFSSIIFNAPLPTNGWTQSNVLALLSVENEMQVWRYFTNPALLPPAITPAYDAANHPDQLPVSWTLPTGANTSQLEYAWLENETQSSYNVNGVFSSDKLFQLNSTRVDIDTSNKVFNIPLLYDADQATGGGKLYYRVRSALRRKDGSLITGAWGTAQTFTYNGHEPKLNWQSSTSFAENGKTKTVIQYFDGSLRPRQTVTKDNTTGKTTVAETIYDMQGRAIVQILPTPTISDTIGYYRDFNRFSGQTTNDDPAKYFDLAVAGTQCSGAPQLDITHGNGIYYSANNPWKASTAEPAAKFIPDANGYAYTETRYTDDATQRVSSQGGVGKAHQIGSGHETKYYYGKPTQDELDALFGTEVGDASHYFKNMVQDANGQMSVSYVDMHGRTVATALAGSAPAKMASINTNTAFYPVSAGQLTGKLITPATNIVRGDSIEAIGTILVPTNNTYTFNYQLTPAILQQFDVNAQQICFDCKYNLEISIRQEDCSGAAPIVKKYSNLQLVPANQACGTPMGFIGDNGNTPQTQISFSQALTVGSWVIRKTLSIDDAAFKVRHDSALKAFLFVSQQHINDSVLTALSATSNCNTLPVTRNCTACQAMLGTRVTYKANFIASVGGTTTLTDAAINAQYTQDSLACANACGFSNNPSMNTLVGIRRQMLNDMMPYTGQYALPLDSIGSLTFLQAKYNIFTASYSDTHAFGQFAGTTKPFYLHPVTEPSGVAGNYLAADGSVDNVIYPGGIPGTLTNITTDSFANMFNPAWANQLIYYHPEYKKLNFAETTLKTSYDWLDSVLRCNTYAQASINGYLTPVSSDPYFVNNYVPGDKTNMLRYLTQYIGNAGATLKASIWRMANSQVLCDTSLPASVRRSCMIGLDSTKLDINATTNAQKDAVWQAFKSSYLGFRNEMLINYINAQQVASLSQTAMDTLQLEGKQLRFANGQDNADQNGITWWAYANSATPDSSTMVALGNAAIAANTSDQCIAQRPFWKARLLQCERLKQYLATQFPADTLTVTTITNAILDSMVMVCHFSSDAKNPAGASNVNPALMPKVPANFEDIVNHVFTQYGIATLPNNYYFCNPYTIDNPKPYNANPPVFVNNKGTLDTCNCKQLSAIKVTAKATGVDTTSMSSMNTYLQTNYSDTLSAVLWQGLLQCYSHAWFKDTCFYSVGCPSCRVAAAPDSCVHLYFLPIKLTAVTTIPPFLNCGYVKPCVTCSALQTYTTAFRTLYPAYASVPYTSAVDTTMAKQNALWARYLNYKTGFNATASQYASAYLTCSYGATGVTDLVLTNRVAQPPTGTTAPLSYTAGNSITMNPGYISTVGDNFSAFIAAGIVASGNALCAFDKPVTYAALPDTTHKNLCQAVQYEAAFIAQVLYQQQKDSLVANFDSLYRAKCLTAQGTEIFTYTYTPSEYHYTLYAYDQAGNLLKTLPPAAVKPNFNATYLAQVKAARAAATDLLNGTNYETMATQYRYNTLNQVMAQQTPDAGKSSFFYDRLGRLVVSQNAKQLAAAAYSYTLYDYLGRITEVGQKPQTAAMSQAISQDTTQLKNWIANLVTGGAKQQMTNTFYDAQPAVAAMGITQLNLRNRVSYTTVTDVDNTNVPPYRAASFYSYDIHGNVDTLVQDYGPTSVMGAASGNRTKLIKYEYDLISGKVNQVSYQPNRPDAFYQQYRYDAENRIVSVFTSRDSVMWQTFADATYTYYRHGPLARTELGDLRVQGVDYAYTLHGWLKSVNPSYTLTGTDLMDTDGTSATPLFARDAYKFNLNYYDDGVNTDYTPIAPPTGYIQGNALPTAAKNNLYNGNISSMAVSLRPITALSSAQYAAPMIYNYAYDQLNRIASMDAWPTNGSFAPLGTVPIGDFSERYTYDPNGNILSLYRHGTTGNGGPLTMDSLTYKYAYAKNTSGFGEYTPGQTPPADLSYFTNRLSSVGDGIAATNYPYAADPQSPSDIDNQAAQNYSYDAIGNMTGDVQAGITGGITWNVYGKILTIAKSGGTITYTYDASGNRISKNYLGITTWYVRDASGNVLSVYVQGDAGKNAGNLTQTELDMYSSSRLGLVNTNLNCVGLATAISAQNVYTRGSRVYELTNHLGNVLVTFSDKKIGVDANSDGAIDYYNADVLTANDYYVFGSQMPGRIFAQGNSKYRYGFNGKEKDMDITAGDYDFGARIYDGRISRWLSVDPSASNAPAESPYVGLGNDPIENIDPDGKFKVPIHKKIIQDALKYLGFDRFSHMAIWSNQQTIDAFDAMNDNTHFDNKFTAQDAYKRWESLTIEIHNAKLGNENDPLTHNGADDDIKLGKVLHTVQDFYAHSNYIELYIQYYKETHNGEIPKQDDIPIYDEGIKDKNFKAELDVNLKTGAFDVPKWLIGKDKKSANKKGHTHHDELNKDDETTPEGKKLVDCRINLHTYARQTAYKHTKKILDEKTKKKD